MRISDWSSDVCSSDLASIALEDFLDRKFEHIGDAEGERQRGIVATGLDRVDALAADAETFGQILLAPALHRAQHLEAVVHASFPRSSSLLRQAPGPSPPNHRMAA